MSALVKDLSINARYDLQRSSVQIFYETSSSVNGSSSLSLATDFYPNPLPTDAASQFNSLQFTVDLQGIQATNSSATLTCETINPTDPAWWQARHPEYTPYDSANPADANNSVSSFSIDAATVQRAANPATSADKNYVNELTTGQIAPWMTFKSQRITITVKGTVTHRNGDIKPVTITHQCVATNATSGTYTNQQISAYPEPVPSGLAQYLYVSISPLQFEGSVSLQEEDVSGSLSVGNVFNFTGSALAEWTAMNALVQEVSENLDTGVTTIQFGPPRTLSAGELVDILRVNRLRLIKSSYSMRAAGTASDSSADLSLGQNTPEKNSVSGVAPPNPAVVSSTPDGTGPIITHLSSALDCSTVWVGDSQTFGAPPPGGQIKIALSDAQGQQLKIQQVNLCLNGVAGSMYFLCSDFIPNS